MFKPKEMPRLEYYKREELKNSNTRKGRKDAENVIDYYLEKDKKQPQKKAALGFWLGAGSSMLGFGGSPITDLDLSRMEKGRDPKSGKKIFTVEKKPRKGQDKAASMFTDGATTAVKSFSVFRNIDKKNTHIYDEIMKESIAELVEEAQRLAWRSTTAKGGGKAYDCNLIVGAIHHHSSRPTGSYDEAVLPDPNEHFHLLFCRKIVTPDGKIRTARNYYLYNHQMHLGLVFRASLAKKLHERLGFNIVKRTDYILEKDVKDKSGKKMKKIYYNTFEIEGFTDEMREYFSKRSQDIKEESKKLGLEGNSIAEGYIASNKKRPKMSFDEETIQSHWEKEAAKFGITEDFINGLKKHDERTAIEYFRTDHEILSLCVDKQGLITERKLFKYLFEEQQYTFVDAKQRLKFMMDSGYISKTSDPFKYKCNLDIKPAYLVQKQYKEAVKNNYGRVAKAFVYNYRNMDGIKFADLDIINNKIPDNHKVGVLNTSVSKKNFIEPKSDVKNYSSISTTPVGDDINSQIISLGVVVSDLEAQLSDSSLDEDKRIKIGADIIKVKKQIAALQIEKMKKDQEEMERKKLPKP